VKEAATTTLDLGSGYPKFAFENWSEESGPHRWLLFEAYPTVVLGLPVVMGPYPSLRR
jgi:hypothetical protein